MYRRRQLHLSQDRYLMTLIYSYLWIYNWANKRVLSKFRRNRCSATMLRSYRTSPTTMPIIITIIALNFSRLGKCKDWNIKLNRKEDWIGEPNNTRSRLVTGCACAHHQAPPVVRIHPCRLPLLANLQNAHWLYNQPTFPAVFCIISTKIMLLQVCLHYFLQRQLFFHLHLYRFIL